MKETILKGATAIIEGGNVFVEVDGEHGWGARIGGKEDYKLTIRAEATRKQCGVPVSREHPCDGTGCGPETKRCDVMRHCAASTLSLHASECTAPTSLL